ncbi:MAG: efflux RND transporter permease subunit [Candidatus Omnitrophota bacterium]
MKKILDWVFKHPKTVMGCVAFAAFLAATQFPRIKVDTDPENMLPHDAPVRVFHRDVKKEFGIYDMIVLGVVREDHPQGVFNPESLARIYSIVQETKKISGVIKSEIVALSTKDNIEQGGIGTVKFSWLMPEPPETQEEANRILREAQDHPMFAGSSVSTSGKALAVYVPIEKKDLSYEVAEEIRALLKEHAGPEEFYITGLPVANDQFGVEMFKQMAISAPLAGLIIFLLMWWFFKSFSLVIAPMLMAVATVLITMGLLIGFGFPVHIMSSMIPIFLMPIAVLDSVHILSEFFDQYQNFGSRKEALHHVIKDLFSPMLFTSMTSFAGFFSLSFSPIPPVQVFGVFVAIGIAVAWLLTMVFIPAYIMLMNPKRFEAFGRTAEKEEHHGIMDRFLQGMKSAVLKWPGRIVILAALILIISFYGISKIQVNDNPIRWFRRGHPIRLADRVLNKHFAGTYQAYFVMDARKEGEVFKSPDMLRYMERLQEHMVSREDVGKIMSLTDIVKKVYDELMGGDKTYDRIPDTRQAVAQTLISFQNSHQPDDLWKLVTPQYDKAVLWVQLKSGDNQDMSRVVRQFEEYMVENPPPVEVDTGWAGLNYINVVWQNNMVGGMLKNFLGSYIIVLFMMLFLFRSPLKALISMIPLTITILFIYSLLGFIGKDYDMPVAVLSALTLGLSIDFAIHFIKRSIEIHRTAGNWLSTADIMFAEPGRAILRNAIVVAIGFLPLLLAPLIPYRTVGFFMFMIMAVSSVATLILIPAIIMLKPAVMFAEFKQRIPCRCVHCVLTAVFVGAAVAYVLEGYTLTGWPVIAYVSLGVIALLAGLCYAASKNKICYNNEEA